jgi:hypothetical protein
MSVWGGASPWTEQFLIPLHHLYLFLRQPIQRIDPLIDLGIHLCFPKARNDGGYT